MKGMVSALVLAAAAVMGAGSARAQIRVNFSITGTVLEPGTVTGHLLFDAAGTGVRATGAYVDTAPSRFFLFANDNLVTALHNQSNAFTVTADGAVTSASLYLFGNAYIYGGDPAQSGAGVTGDYFQLNDFGTNSYEQDFAYPYPFGSSFSAVSNQGGLAGATYTSAAAAPEPSAWAMLAVGAGVIGCALCRRAGRQRPVALA